MNKLDGIKLRLDGLGKPWKGIDEPIKVSLSEGYSKGQIDMFNRLYDIVVDKQPTDIDGVVVLCTKLVAELNKIRQELTNEEV